VVTAGVNRFGSVYVLRTKSAQKQELQQKRKGEGDVNVVEEDGAHVGLRGTWQGEEPHSGLPEGL
jgi:hypothetical protein